MLGIRKLIDFVLVNDSKIIELERRLEEDKAEVNGLNIELTQAEYNLAKLLVEVAEINKSKFNVT